MGRMKLETPVLYLIYNRLDLVKKTFPAIQKAKPPQLFISGDGPKDQEDEIKVQETRDWILDNINWECEVKTKFHLINLGCKRAVIKGINWFFENVKEGIILEDDILPSQSLFRFCEEMLNAYSEHRNFSSVSGLNIRDTDKNLLFAKGVSVWGWATWKHAWEGFNPDFYGWNTERRIQNINLREHYPTIISRIRARRNLDLISKGKLDTWDYQWQHYNLLTTKFQIIPPKNLVENIGFKEGTHTSNANYNLKKHDIRFPLRYPENNDVPIDHTYFKQFLKFFQKGWMSRKLRRLIG